MKSTPPAASFPKVWCDFNACGWSGAPGDNCYYVFDQKALAALNPVEGMGLSIYDDEDTGEVFGCEARLERFNDSWRIRPDKDTWFRGSPTTIHTAQERTPINGYG